MRDKPWNGCSYKTKSTNLYPILPTHMHDALYVLVCTCAHACTDSARNSCLACLPCCLQRNSSLRLRTLSSHRVRKSFFRTLPSNLLSASRVLLASSVSSTPTFFSRQCSLSPGFFLILGGRLLKANRLRRRLFLPDCPFLDLFCFFPLRLILQ